MKKAVLLAVLFSLLLVLPAQAQDVLPSYLLDRNARLGGGCFGTGQIIVTFGEAGQTEYDVRDLNVTIHRVVSAKVFGPNISLDGWWYYSDPYKDPSVWKDSKYVEYIEYPNWKNVYADNPRSPVFVNREESMFASEEGHARETGQYRVYITNSTGDSIHTTDVACPGLKFSCDLVNVTIDRCYNLPGTFYAIFGVEGMKQSDLKGARQLNITQDFNFTLTGEKLKRIRSTFPNGTRLEHLGGEKYSMELDVKFEVKNFTLGVKACQPDHPFYYEGSWEKLECEPLPECYSDLECDDLNACTIDTCQKKMCHHEDICKPVNVTPPNITVEPERPKSILDIWWEAIMKFFTIFGG